VNRRLAGWGVLVAALIAQGYAGNYAVKTKDDNLLYHYSTAVASALVYAVMLGIVLWIAVRRHDLLALRRPSSSWLAAIGLTVLLFVAAEIAIQAMDPFLHAGREQGLIPQHWLPRHAGAYAANWFVVAGIAPFVEELTFRGVGYSLIDERFGKWAAIVGTGLLFAASHGLVQALPELATLGFALAWLRSRTGSIYPGMVVHSIFNSLALSAVFFHTTH
jgi:membrane protease YdiL (CAAX protease family)